MISWGHVYLVDSTLTRTSKRYSRLKYTCFSYFSSCSSLVAGSNEKEEPSLLVHHLCHNLIDFQGQMMVVSNLNNIIKYENIIQNDEELGVARTRQKSWSDSINSNLKMLCSSIIFNPF